MCCCSGPCLCLSWGPWRVGLRLVEVESCENRRCDHGSDFWILIAAINFMQTEESLSSQSLLGCCGLHRLDFFDISNVQEDCRP